MLRPRRLTHRLLNPVQAKPIAVAITKTKSKTTIVKLISMCRQRGSPVLRSQYAKWAGYAGRDAPYWAAGTQAQG